MMKWWKDLDFSHRHTQTLAQRTSLAKGAIADAKM